MRIGVHNGLKELLALLGVGRQFGVARQDGNVAGAGRAEADAGESDVARTAAGGDVRMEKVEAVRAALATGRYNVPARAVAVKMLESMLTGGRRRVLPDRRRKVRVGHRALIRRRRRGSGR